MLKPAQTHHDFAPRELNRLMFFGLLLALGLFAQPTQQSRREVWLSDTEAANQALTNKNLAAFRDATLKLTHDFPGNAHVLHNLAAIEARLGNFDASRQALRKYLAMGLLPDMHSQGMQVLRDAGKLTDLPEVQKNAERVSRSVSVFQLSDPDLIAEDIAYDSASSRFFISSVRKRKIIRCMSSGKCEDFITSTTAGSLLGMMALNVDSTRHVLWATTAGINATAGFKPDEDGKSAILKFDLHSGKLLKRYQPQDGAKHAMGDMTVSASGDVYVSDGLSGDVYIIDAKSDVLEPLLPNGNFISPQTPALSRDGKVLYIADYAQGIGAVSLQDHTVTWLSTTSPTATFACDGLYMLRNRLIGVQNGTNPNRIVMFTLSSQTEIVGWQVLEANWPGLGDPTHGVLVGDDLYFIANSGWNRLDEESGALKPGQPTEIRKFRVP